MPSICRHCPGKRECQGWLTHTNRKGEMCRHCSAKCFEKVHPHEKRPVKSAKYIQLCKFIDSASGVKCEKWAQDCGGYCRNHQSLTLRSVIKARKETSRSIDMIGTNRLGQASSQSSKLSLRQKRKHAPEDEKSAKVTRKRKRDGNSGGDGGGGGSGGGGGGDGVVPSKLPLSRVVISVTSDRDASTTYEELKHRARLLGAAVSGIVHKNVVALVATEQAANVGTQRLRKANKFGIPVVTPAWLKACREAGHVVDMKPFMQPYVLNPRGRRGFSSSLPEEKESYESAQQESLAEQCSQPQRGDVGQRTTLRANPGDTKIHKWLDTVQLGFGFKYSEAVGFPILQCLLDLDVAGLKQVRNELIEASGSGMWEVSSIMDALSKERELHKAPVCESVLQSSTWTMNSLDSSSSIDQQEPLSAGHDLRRESIPGGVCEGGPPTGGDGITIGGWGGALTDLGCCCSCHDSGAASCSWCADAHPELVPVQGDSRFSPY